MSGGSVLELEQEKMIVVNKTINELQYGDIIDKSIYKDSFLIVKRGTIVDEKVIKILNKWGVSSTLVLVPYLEGEVSKDVNKKKYEKKKIVKNSFLVSVSHLKELFHETLQKIANENRYGFILNEEEDVKFIEDLFVSIASNTSVYNKLILLKQWDNYSFIHSFDVFVLFSLFIRNLNVDNIRDIAKAALLYDTGKIKISQKVLQKKDVLTFDELELIKEHPRLSYEIIKDDIVEDNIRSIIIDHHERLDGTGYPNQKKEREISFLARVLAIIDVYSALTLERADRYPLTAQKALEFLLNYRKKFDYSIVVKFINLIRIFPLHCFVQLSNKKKAQIIYVYNNAPCLPTVKEIYSKKTYRIPFDLSISVEQFLSWDRHEKRQLEWDTFIEALIQNKEKEAFQSFKELSFESLNDDAYADIVVPAMKELFDRGENPSIVEQIYLQWMREKTFARV